MQNDCIILPDIFPLFFTALFIIAVVYGHYYTSDMLHFTTRAQSFWGIVSGNHVLDYLWING